MVAACRVDGTSLHPTGDTNDDVTSLEAFVDEHPEDDQARRRLALLRWLELGQGDKAKADLTVLAEHHDPRALWALVVMAEARAERADVHRYAAALIDGLLSSSPDNEDHVFHVAAADRALAWSLNLHGDLPDDDDRFESLAIRWLKSDDLPISLRQRIVSQLAEIGRRQGKDVSIFYRAMGCVQAWEVGPVEGSLGPVELRRTDRVTSEDDPIGKAVALNCAVRVWNPTHRSGVRRMTTWLDVPRSTLALDVDTGSPSIVRLDGVELFATDRTDRYPDDRGRPMLHVAPGPHQLEVLMAVNAGQPAWAHVRAVDEHGQPIPHQSKRPTGTREGRQGDEMSVVSSTWIDLDRLRGPRTEWSRLDDPLFDLLALYQALELGHTDHAEHIARRLQPLERFAEGYLARSRFERADPSRPAATSAAREQAALTAALNIAPKLDTARLRRLDLMLRRGQGSDVVDALAELDQKTLHTVDSELFRYVVQSQEGNEHLALAALERAVKLHPTGCPVLAAQRSEARDRHDVYREDQATIALDQCAGTRSVRAHWAETRGRTKMAEALWNEALEDTPDNFEALEGLARIATARGDRATATRHYEMILSYNPMEVRALVALADLDAAAGDLVSARSRLRRALEVLPHSDDLHQVASRLGIADDLFEFRVDGLEALRDYQRSGAQHDGVAEVLVLDHSAARVYDNGGLRQIVHLVVHLLSKEALDRYGQIEVPDSARLLTLRSIKPDGSVLEPEIVAGKNGVELRDLAIGDVIDYEFLVETPPHPVLPGYVDVTTFRFQSFDVPYHRSELVMVHPESVELNIERRNDPPTDERRTIQRDDERLVVHQWTAHRVPRAGIEPHVASTIEQLPNVRITTDVDLARWAHSVGGEWMAATRSNPELRELTRRLVRGRRADRDRFAALWSWVMNNIDEGGDITTPATVTLTARSGNRLTLLQAMASAVDIKTDLLVARDRFDPPAVEGGAPMLDTYEQPLMVVDGDLVALPLAQAVPLGYVPPNLGEASAVRIPTSSVEAMSLVETTLPPASGDHRTWAITITVDDHGDGTVAGTLELTGLEAIRWRQALRDIDRDRWNEVFLRAELGWLRGASLDRLEVEHAKEPDVPLRWVFRATAPGLGALEEGGAMILRSGLVPLNSAAEFASLPARKTTMLIPYAPLISAEITYRFSGQARPQGVPEAIDIHGPWGRFQRTVEHQSSEAVLRYRSELRAGRIKPDDYAAFAEHARQIESSLRSPIRAVTP